MKNRCRIFSFVGIEGFFSIGYYDYGAESIEERDERRRSEIEEKKLLEKYQFLLSFDKLCPYAVAKEFVNTLGIAGISLNYNLVVYKDLYGLFKFNKSKSFISAFDKIIINTKLFNRIKKRKLINKNIIAQLLKNNGYKFFIYNNLYLYIPSIECIYSIPITSEPEKTLTGESYVVFSVNDKLNNRIEKQISQKCTKLENLVTNTISLKQVKETIFEISNQPTTSRNFLLKRQLPTDNSVDKWILHLGLDKLERFLLDAMEVQIQDENISCKFASALILSTTAKKFTVEKMRNWYNKGKIPGVKSDKIYVSISWVLEYISKSLGKDIFTPIQLMPYIKKNKK